MNTNTNKHESRCKSLTKAGKPCRAAATEGGLCFFHANPAKASELGRIGGRKNRHIIAASLDPFPDLKTALDVRETVDRVIKEVCARRIDPRTAAALTPLFSLQLRAIETSDLERRLLALEKRDQEDASKTQSAGKSEEGDVDGSGKPHGIQ